MSELQNLEDGHIEARDLSSHAIIAGLRSDFWKKIICYESVDSTNELALALSLKSPESRTVIIADSQEKGRGRLGRVWVSPPGRNIYMSAVLIPEIEPRDVAFLTIAAALACASALRSKTGLIVNIKWPNDLMARSKKIGGILTELRSGHDKINFAVVGIGINVNSGGEDFPEELGQIATSVKEETGRYYSRSGIIAEVLNELEQRYEKLINEGRFPLLEEWRKLSSTVGKRVRITLCKEVLSGLAEEIDKEGMLVLKLVSGERRRISAGELTELR
jgi:BirA family biotin operon repressor/biotin-[acetyl-CoA-carboxylase] ligase